MNTLRLRCLSVAILPALLLGFVGCSGGSGGMTGPATRILRITPSDGATAVRLDAAIVLDFGAPVDRAAVEAGVHLISDTDMYAECPDTTMTSHGTMDSIMQDPAMLDHMGQFHATPTRLAWNEAGSTCTLQPDSLMRPDTRYMVYMSSHMIRGMQNTGVMMSGGTMNGAGDMMTHYQTVSASGHEGHH